MASWLGCVWHLINLIKTLHKIKEIAIPLPTPKKGEGQSSFVSRCMSNTQAKKDFPNRQQRLAVCFSRFKKKKKSIAERLKELGDFLFNRKKGL